MEKVAGIYNYLSPDVPGFSGIIKFSHHDFMFVFCCFMTVFLYI
jgi:hypothetical protein